MSLFDVDAYFRACNNVHLSEEEHASMRGTIERWFFGGEGISEEGYVPSLDAEEKFELFERLYERSRLPTRAKRPPAPLFFGMWSGTKLFHVLKPFYCKHVKRV